MLERDRTTGGGPALWSPNEYRGRHVHIRPLFNRRRFSHKQTACAATLFSTMVAFTLFLSFSLANAISVIPGTGYLPASVRAACRSALSQTLAGCSDLIQYPEEYVDVSSLSNVCTTQCRQSLSDMYTRAVSACGSTSVNVTTNITSQILVPLDLAAQLVFQYNVTCLEDEYYILC